MPISSPFTEQLATLGVLLPAWPEEPEGGDATGDWIQQGQAYAEGIRLWRAKLRNAPESTKGVVDQLLRHLQDTGQLGAWDQLLSEAIKPEALGSSDDERWQACTRLIGSSALTPAQLLGMALELARQGRVGAATDGLKQLINKHPGMSSQERLQLCTELVAAANTSQLMNVAQSATAGWERAAVVHEQMTGLLAEAMAADSPLLDRLDVIINCLGGKAKHKSESVIRAYRNKSDVAPLTGHVCTGPPVTLTAISSRLSTLPAVLESLWKQTYKPAQVHLHLSHEPHLLDQGVGADDPLLKEITCDGWVQLHWVPNLGPYRKIVPFLQEAGYGQAAAARSNDDLFITIDDDTIYPPRFIEYMVRNYERYQCVVAHRGRRIRLEAADPFKSFRPYAEWHDGVHEPRLANLPTGQSGVLYRRSWFPDDLELEAALVLAPSHDDLWIHWLTARQGVPAVILQPNAAAKTKELAFPAVSSEPFEQAKSLWEVYNRAAGGNDDAVVSVQGYWQTRGFDLASLLAEEQEHQADFY